MSELSIGDDNNTDTNSSGENWRDLTAGYNNKPPSSLGTEGGHDHDDKDGKKGLDDNYEKKDMDWTTTIVSSSFLLLPSMVREKIYLYLNQKDLLTLRKVCHHILHEVNNFADFTVVFRKPLTRSVVPIPFPHLKFLTVDNPNDDLPWYWESPTNNNINCSGTEKNLQSHKVDEENDKITLHNNYFGRRGTIEAIKLMATTPNTLLRLAQCRTIKRAIMTTDVFDHRINTNFKMPQLHWPFLTNLRLHFYIVRFVGSHELEMLENFDSLCRQTFPSLTSLKICLRRSYLNPQSSFSVRALRFMAKHWRTLRDMTIEMEAEKCDLYPQSTTPEFSQEELENLEKIQLDSLKIDATELVCRKCRIWQDFIMQQNSINSLKISVYAAQGHPIFFYPVNRNPKKRTMRTLSIGLWGAQGSYPIDFRLLTNGLDVIHNVRLFRSPTIITEAMDGPEILNMTHIPQNIVSLTIKGFIVASRDVEILFRSAQTLNHLTMKNIGAILGETGVQMEHLPLLLSHGSLATCCLDVNNPRPCPDESYELFRRTLDNPGTGIGSGQQQQQQGQIIRRMEYKVIASRDNIHTFLFIDRQRAQNILMQKCKPHDDDVLPGLEYPTGFLNRFDNWKIRS